MLPDREVGVAVIPNAEFWRDNTVGLLEVFGGDIGELFEVVKDRVLGNSLDVSRGEELAADDDVEAVHGERIDCEGGVVAELLKSPVEGFDDFAVAHGGVDAGVVDVDEVEFVGGRHVGGIIGNANGSSNVEW